MRLVWIDPGHGGEDRGNVEGEVTESNVAYWIALCLRCSLKWKGIEGRLTRWGRGDDVSIENRMVGKGGAGAYISLHHRFDTQGARVYTGFAEGPGCSLSAEVSNRLRDALSPHRVEEHRGGQAVLRQEVPAILVEISDKAEVLANNEQAVIIAEVLAEALDAFLGSDAAWGTSLNTL